MTGSTAKAPQVAATLCALALSLLTFTGTISNPTPAHASVAYVGVVA